MARLTRDSLKRAFDRGIDTFLRSLNSELESQATQETLPGVPPPDLTGQKMRVIIAHYIVCYQKRYPKARPDVGSKSQGILLRMLKDYSEDQLKDLISVYLQLEDKWFLDWHHDLATFEARIQRILHATTTGLKSAQLTNIEKADQLRQEQERKSVL